MLTSTIPQEALLIIAGNGDIGDRQNLSMCQDLRLPSLYPARGHVISVNNSMIIFAHSSASSSLITLVFAVIGSHNSLRTCPLDLSEGFLQVSKIAP
jgi:hypothetical protein